MEAAEVFAAAGYDASSTVIPGATHLSIIGHEVIADEFITIANDPARAAVVELILDAISGAR